MPNKSGLAYALSAGANSILILDQSASSSSASSIGNAVVTPWPISERSTITSTLSSAPMRNHALGASGAAAAVRNRDPDRKSTRLNSSHSQISYAVFCLQKKQTQPHQPASP